MCILPETTLKLSWSAASDYCLRHGAVLAQDAVVIKTRRYLNDLYGETGTRERWPLWVGGKEIMKDHEKTWMWADSSLVPDFLWNKGHPRSYTRRQAPDGTCMFLDGYKNFYASSLPCHYRRRFVCQLPD
nr:C-type lectin BfL-2-like [Cherax quadricarinatus]